MNEPIYFSVKDMAKMTQERDSWRMTAADTARDFVRLTKLNEELQSLDLLQQGAIERLQEGMELAWGLIANAWDVATEVNGWENAAKTWRDEHWNRAASQLSECQSETPDPESTGDS